ncbi:MAG: alanyl-tRNA synthetase, partial [Blastocatellia bacterium]|nr:alanyl-tRNA synthetase [Blastocatellia bacterium]
MSAYDSFDEQKKFACRVIADHARATAFSIADGILPGNEGRNYVLRKIMRRAIYQGRHALGLTDAFFYKVTNFVVDQMGEAYPELEASREFIEKMVKLEEERFGSTMTVGLQKLPMALQAIDRALNEQLKPAFELARRMADQMSEFESALAKKSEPIIELAKRVNEVREQTNKKWNERLAPMLELARQVNEQANQTNEEMRKTLAPLLELARESWISKAKFVDLAKLYDTFGTPRDLIRIGLEERGFMMDEEQFNQSFDAALQELQRSTTTVSGEGKGKSNPTYLELVGRVSKSQFKGYEATRVDDAKVVALIKGDAEVQSVNEGDEGEVILDQTPFYAESGGQVGDVGRLINPVATAPGTDLIALVVDTYSPAQRLIVHKVKIEKGTLKVGDVVTAEVDVEKRDATRRNHTATHLMHAALREVLGTHVKQAGSVVAPNYLRFDFSHYQPLTTSEIEEVERLVNYHILRNEPVETDEMAVEEAMRSGAMALFGEKYGEKVRVLSIKGAEDIFSKELCGGTHVRATGDIGVFKITSDESIASGVRRIRAVTGLDAYERFREDEEIIGQVTSNLRTSRAELPAMIGKLQDELKKARREADELRLKIATGAAGSASSNGDDAREVNGVRVLAREASGLDAAGMRQLSDTLLARIKSGVVVVGRSNDGKASLIVRTSDDLTKKIPAGQVIKELAPIIGGKGGGKPDMA